MHPFQIDWFLFSLLAIKLCTRGSPSAEVHQINTVASVALKKTCILQPRN